MRKFKKILCAVLTSTMVLAMAAPSFAALPTGTGSITINSNTEGAQANRSYTAYQIFTLESRSGDNYSYKVVDAWKNFIEGYQVNGTNAFTLTSNGYLLSTTIEKDSNEAAAFAKAALAAVPQLEGEVPSQTIEAIEGDASLNNIGLGYYLIDSTVGTVCVLTTNAPDVTVTDKNIAPSLTKRVDTADQGVQVGQTATYQLVVSAGNGGQDYVLTDTMTTDTLRFVDDSLHVYVVTELGENDALPEDAVEFASTNYTFAKTPTGFTLTFPNAVTSDWTADTKVVVRYSATVLAPAATGAEINNTAHLGYGDGQTTPETPDTPSKTYQFEVQKIAAETEAELYGAQFSLYSQETGGEAIALVNLTPNAAENELKVYRVATANDANDPNRTTTINMGYAIIKGLDNTQYWLQEDVAPQGYNMLASRESFTPSVAATDSMVAAAAAGLQVKNSTGAILPSTGGIGTTVFYAAGIILMAGAVFFVVRRKRA